MMQYEKQFEKRFQQQPILVLVSMYSMYII